MLSSKDKTQKQKHLNTVATAPRQETTKTRKKLDFITKTLQNPAASTGFKGHDMPGLNPDGCQGISIEEN